MGNTDSGWSMIANEDNGAAVMAGLLSLEPEKVYPRSELAEAAGIPLKTLYLVELLDHLETAGMLERIDAKDELSEECWTINPDSDVYQTAKQFDDALADHLVAAD